MTNYSRTTLRELKKRYLNILKKCLLANLMAFSFVLPTRAEIVTDSESLKTALEESERIIVEADTSENPQILVLTYNEDDEMNIDHIFPSVSFTSDATGRGSRLYNTGNITFNSATKLIFKDNILSTTASWTSIMGGSIFNSGNLIFNTSVDFIKNNGHTAVHSGVLGGAIYNTEGSLIFNGMTKFVKNRAVSTSVYAPVNGGAIAQERSTDGIIFNDKVYFIQNEANSNSNNFYGGNGGAIHSKYSKLQFEKDVFFKGNKAVSSMIRSVGGALSISYNTTIINGPVDFIGNKAISDTGVAKGGALYIADQGISFNNSFTFIDNIVRTNSQTNKAQGADVYLENSIYHKNILFNNNEGSVGSLSGGIYNGGNASIEKKGEGILIFGDEMKNEYETYKQVNETTNQETIYTPVYTQTKGLTISKSENFDIAAKNTITGNSSELRLHGESINGLTKRDEETNELIKTLTISGDATLTFLKTSIGEQVVSLGDIDLKDGHLVLGAYSDAIKESEIKLLNGKEYSYVDDNETFEDETDDKVICGKVSDKLFISPTIEYANYVLNADEALKTKSITFKDSHIKLKGSNYKGNYVLKDNSFLDTVNDSIETTEVSFEKLSGNGGLNIDVSFVKNQTNQIDIIVDKFNLNAPTTHVFNDIKINVLNAELLQDGLTPNGGTGTPITYYATVLKGDATFSDINKAWATTTSPYAYKLITEDKAISLTALELEEEGLKFVNDYEGTSAFQMAVEGSKADYTVTENLGTMGGGIKQIIGATNEVKDSVIIVDNEDGTLFKVNNTNTDLTIKDITISGAKEVVENIKGSVTLENVVINETTGKSAIINSDEMFLKEITVDKGIENNGEMTASNVTGSIFKNSKTLTGNNLTIETFVNTDLGIASLDETNKIDIIKNAGTITFNSKQNLKEIENHGYLIVTDDIAIKSLTGNGTISVSNAVLNVADKFETSNNIVSNNMILSDNLKELTANELEVKENTALDIDNKKLQVDKVIFGSGSTLYVTLHHLNDYGTLNYEEVEGAEKGKLKLKLKKGLDQEEGIYKIFNQDNALKLEENELFAITDNQDGSYHVERKSVKALAKKFDISQENASVIRAFIDGSNDHSAFNQMQSEILEALQSEDKGKVQKAKKALSAVGAKEHPVEQSVASEHLVALQNVVQAELHGSTIGHSGGDTDPRAKVYIKGLYDRTKSSMGEGFRARSKGAVLGVQSEVTEDLTLGVGYATSQTTAKEDLRRTEVDTNTGFVSAHYQPNAWWVSGLATFSRGEYEEEKQILSSMGKASYDVESWGAQVMTGYDIKLENAIITPEVGLRYLSVKQEGYTDTLGTTVSGTQSDYLTALVGVKGTWDMGAIRPTAGVTVGYDIISDDISALNTLANGASYTVNGEALDRLSTGVSLGVEADLGDRTTLKLEYSGTYRKEYVDHSGMIKFELRF